MQIFVLKSRQKLSSLCIPICPCEHASKFIWDSWRLVQSILLSILASSYFSNKTQSIFLLIFLNENLFNGTDNCSQHHVQRSSQMFEDLKLQLSPICQCLSCSLLYLMTCAIARSSLKTHPSVIKTTRRTILLSGKAKCQ